MCFMNGSCFECKVRAINRSPEISFTCISMPHHAPQPESASCDCSNVKQIETIARTLAGQQTPIQHRRGKASAQSVVNRLCGSKDVLECHVYLVRCCPEPCAADLRTVLYILALSEAGRSRLSSLLEPRHLIYLAHFRGNPLSSNQS
jgi:hypothetical protein